MKFLGVACVAFTASARAQCLEWGRGFGLPGLDGGVSALATYDPGSGPTLYLGGSFTHADDLAVGRVASWDGTSFAALGAGVDGPVAALCAFDDGTGPALYVGGGFTSAGGTNALFVARWDGTAWSPVGAGFDGAVLALGVHDDGTGPVLYAGGAFTHSGSSNVRRLARWDGAQWNEVGGGLDAPVDALASWSGGLAVGGEFTLAGALPVSNVANWSAGAWSAFGAGFASAVLALTSFDDGSSVQLYAGGDFTTSGGSPVNHVAKWTGSTWTNLGAGVSSSVFCFLPIQGVELYVGGDLFQAGSVGTTGVARWRQSGWIGGGATRNVRALALFDDGGGASTQVFAGGLFQANPSSDPWSGLARFDGSRWIPVGGADGLHVFQASGQFVTALETVVGASAALDGLYATGRFAYAGDALARQVARFDGTRWHAFGDGIPSVNPPRCVAAFDAGSGPEIYVGGSFTSIGSVSMNYITRWDGVAWRTVGGGTDSHVLALQAFDDGSGPALYVGGVFAHAGGLATPCVARWDASGWHPVGAGLQGTVHAFAVYDDGGGPKLYAGCNSPSTVSVWDGSTWTPIASVLVCTTPGVNTWVESLAVFDAGGGPELYAGGTFTTPALHLARWNGTSWSDVGGGIVEGAPTGLVAFDDASGGGPALYACGGFSHVGGGVSAARVARWDGTAWSALGAGVSDDAYALASFDGDLYVGGDFASAGGVTSRRIARWNGCGPVSSFCAGDGLDAHVTTSCPCGNAGAPGHGCAWHAGPAGALLAASGATNPDTLVLTASGMPAIAPTTIFLKGDALVATGAVFGDGVRCIGGNLIRLGNKVNVSGAAQYPEPGNVPISLRGQTPVGSGAVAYYQTYYRNAASFCTSSTFNVTNGVRVAW